MVRAARSSIDVISALSIGRDGRNRQTTELPRDVAQFLAKIDKAAPQLRRSRSSTDQRDPQLFLYVAGKLISPVTIQPRAGHALYKFHRRNHCHRSRLAGLVWKGPRGHYNISGIVLLVQMDWRLRGSHAGPILTLWGESLAERRDRLQATRSEYHLSRGTAACRFPSRAVENPRFSTARPFNSICSLPTRRAHVSPEGLCCRTATHLPPRRGGMGLPAIHRSDPKPARHR